MKALQKTREDLRPFLKKRIRVTGLFNKRDIWSDPHTRREYYTVCLSQVENDKGEMLADHVWVHHANEIADSKPEIYASISLTALVCEYRKDGIVSCYLDNPKDIEIMKKPPAFSIPEPRTETHDHTPKLPSPPPPAPAAADGLGQLIEVKGLADRLGGLDRLEELISILRTLGK